MTGIVERLQTRYKVKCNRCLHFDCDTSTVHEVMDGAAAEIERLSRIADAAREVASCPDSGDGMVEVKWDEMTVLRDALHAYDQAVS